MDSSFKLYVYFVTWKSFVKCPSGCSNWDIHKKMSYLAHVNALITVKKVVDLCFSKLTLRVSFMKFLYLSQVKVDGFERACYNVPVTGPL